MGTTTFRVINNNPFTVEYLNGNKRKQVKYDVMLLHKEILANMEYIVFDEESAEPPKMNRYRLMEAIALISSLYGEVTGIQFEDGSGYNFNFHVAGGQWQFISLRNMATSLKT